MTSLHNDKPRTRKLEFAYDWMGRRMEKKVSDEISSAMTVVDKRRFAYDGWNMIAEFTVDGGGNLTPDRQYTWGTDLSGSEQGAGGVGGLLSVSNGGTPLIACYDGNGNIVAWMNASGAAVARQDYDPFGNRIIREGVEIPVGFSTKYEDRETGMLYYGHRYYDPETGRWPSRDPIEERGGVNLYGFVGNRSLNTIDILGLWNRDKSMPWSGGSRGPYKGKVCSDSTDDTWANLAKAITGNGIDGQLFGGREIKLGDIVDISILLSELEKNNRREVKKATKSFNANFGDPNDDLSDIEDWFGDKKKCTGDCQNAVMLVLAKGLKESIGHTKYSGGGYYPSSSGLLLTAISAGIADAKIGDYGAFANDDLYLSVHPGGGWQAENVINVGPNLFWGHPGGSHTSEQWIKKLISAFNDGSPYQITEIPGWRGRVAFFDNAKIGMKNFDLDYP